MPEPRLGRPQTSTPSEATFFLRGLTRVVDLIPPGPLQVPFESATWVTAPPVASDATVRLRPSRDTSQGAPTGDGARGTTASTKRADPKATCEPPALGARIGVISDTHGYLDLEILEIFAGVTHIIHAGDIVDPGILHLLEAVAPVTAVAGNMDSDELAATLPREVAGQIAGVHFVLGHKRKRLLERLDAGRIEGVGEDTKPDLVVYGHEHVPTAVWVDGTLFLNPGTASAPEEEDDGPTVAIVTVRESGLAVAFLPLKPRARD